MALSQRDHESYNVPCDSHSLWCKENSWSKVFTPTCFPKRHVLSLKFLGYFFPRSPLNVVFLIAIMKKISRVHFEFRADEMYCFN